MDVSECEGEAPDVAEEEDAVREAEAEFVRRQSVMARNIRDYGRTITLKEERLKELEVCIPARLWLYYPAWDSATVRVCC